jgi:phosphomannomutase
MKRLLKAQNARFGGELSGHYYFADCFNTDSGLMAMIQVINIWQKNQNGDSSTLAQLIAPLRKYVATGELNYRVPDVQAVLQKIESYYAPSATKIDHLDGLTVELSDWWFNLRSSNTEPLLRLNLEANTATECEAHLKEVQALIGAVPATGH